MSEQTQQQSAGSSAVASLVLGIIAMCAVVGFFAAPPLWFAAPILCIIGFVLGRREVVRVSCGEAPAASHGLAQAGWILSAISFGIWLIETALMLPMVMLLFRLFNTIQTMPVP